MTWSTTEEEALAQTRALIREFDIDWDGLNEAQVEDLLVPIVRGHMEYGRLVCEWASDECSGPLSVNRDPFVAEGIEEPGGNLVLCEAHSDRRADDV